MVAACAAVALATGAVAVVPVAIPSASAADVVTWSGVVRTADGAPVSCVFVQASASDGSWSNGASVGADGAFSFDVVSGTFDVRVGGGLGYGADCAFSVAGLPSSFDVRGSYSLTGSTGDLVLPVASTVTLHVEDVAGNPVSGASYGHGGFLVSATPALGWTSMLMGVGFAGTDADGNATTQAWPTTSWPSFQVE